MTSIDAAIAARAEHFVWTSNQDILNKRYIQLLKYAADVWGNSVSLNLKWMHKILELCEARAESQQQVVKNGITSNRQTQSNQMQVHICLCYLVSVIPREKVVSVFLPL